MQKTGKHTINYTNKLNTFESKILSKKILIIAPHEDDECIMCAGVIDDAVSKGDEVFICIVTNGDFEGEELSALRIQESREVLSRLRVPQDNIIFLGYADTGMPFEESFLFRLYMQENPDYVIPSVFGRKETYFPGNGEEYHLKKFGTHAPFSKRSVQRDFESVIEDILPDEIYVTSLSDLHGDHMAAYCFTVDAVSAIIKDRADYAPNVFHSLIHCGDELMWPNRKKTPTCNDLFEKPSTLAKLGLDWENRICKPIPSSIRNGQNRKENLLQCYKSQIPEAYERFLLAFAKDEEIFFHVDLKNPYYININLLNFKQI